MAGEIQVSPSPDSKAAMEESTMSIDEKEAIRDASEDSLGSTPEAEAGTEATPQDQIASVQKRKGGRKPVSHADILPRGLAT